jgi:hypothetical protein
LWYPSIIAIISYRTVHEIVEIQTKVLKFWSVQYEQDHHSFQVADHFTLHCEHLFTHLWTFYTIVLQFLHSLDFGPKSCTIYNVFSQHSCLSVKKANDSVNFATGRIISRRTCHNSLCRDRNKH